MTTNARKATEDEKKLVRHITFKTNRGVEGCVTGVPMAALCGPDHVAMYSAGCLYALPYIIPAGAKLVRIETL